jgi:hypothetical protein
MEPSGVAMYLPAGVGRAELQLMCGQREADGYHSVWFTERTSSLTPTCTRQLPRRAPTVSGSG